MSSDRVPGKAPDGRPQDGGGMKTARSAAERQLAGGGVGYGRGRPHDDGADAATTTGAVDGPSPEHPGHLRRRHRPDQHQRLYVRAHGIPHAEHRPHCPRGHDVHRLLRRAELHGGAVELHHGTSDAAHRPAPRSGFPAANLRPAVSRTSPSPRRSSRSATPPASSARTISATATTSCRRCTASTSSSATSTTSTPRKSRRIPTIRRTPAFRARFGAARRAQVRGHDRPMTRTVDPRFRPSVGRADDRRTPAALTKKRMETIDDETSAAAIRLHPTANAANRPFFVWFNSTRMHLRIRTCGRRCSGNSGISEYFDGMIEHDGHVGQLLKALDDRQHRQRHDRASTPPTTART